MLHDMEVDVLRALLGYRVRFVVVGGRAVIHHGHLRAAKDVDLFVDRRGDNPAAVVAALNSHGISDPQLTADWLSRPDKQLRINHTIAEILTSVAGLDFGEAYADAASVRVAELQVPVLSREHLIRSKRALDRPQDREDLIALGATDE